MSSIITVVLLSGYVSFVRSYAALPKDVREVFNFQALHLGHYAKSFALRDPPAKINSIGRAGKRNDRTKQFLTARQRQPEATKRPAAALRWVTNNNDIHKLGRAPFFYLILQVGQIPLQ